MRSITCVLFAALLMATAARAQVPAPTTQTGAVSKGTNKVYTFTPPAFGQVTATLSWDVPSAHLLMVMVCGTTDPQPYAIAASLLDRFARFEAGVIAGEPCALAVTSADETANFRLHVIRSGDQALTPSAAAGFVAFGEARPGTFIVDEAVRVLTSVKRLMLR